MATLATSFMREGPANPTAREILRCRTVKNPQRSTDDSASPAELRKALTLLDTNEDGRLAEGDVDILVELALGVDAKNSEGTWRAVKGACTCNDGELDLSFLLKLVDTDLFNKAISQMKHLPPDARLFPFTSVVEYVQVFRDFDKDRNGVVCAGDLQKVINDGIVDVPREHCKDLIRKVDPANSTGVVNLLQFGKLIELVTSADLCTADVMHAL